MITITSPSPQSGGRFGQAVAVSGPGAISSPPPAPTIIPGAQYVVIGAPGQGPLLQTPAGCVYIYDRIHGHFVATIASPNVSNNGEFGSAVAGSTSNEVKVALVGAWGEGHWPKPIPGNPQTGVLTGRAYVYNPATGAEICELATAYPTDQGEFGCSVALQGAPLLIPGAPGLQPGKPVLGLPLAVGALGETVNNLAVAGHAYVFVLSVNPNPPAPFSTPLQPVYTLKSQNPQTNGNFGQSVAIDGKLLLVGAPGEDSRGASHSGNAYFFDISTNPPTPLLTLPSQNPQPQVGMGQGFGFSVALRGNVAVVGSPCESVTIGGSVYSQAGRAYVFNARTGQLVPNGVLTSPDVGAEQGFGASVATDGETVLVGASGQGQYGAYKFNASNGALISSLNPGGGTASVADPASPVLGNPYLVNEGSVSIS